MKEHASSCMSVIQQHVYTQLCDREKDREGESKRRYGRGRLTGKRKDGGEEEDRGEEERQRRGGKTEERKKDRGEEER